MSASASLRAGAAMVDITPRAGTHLAGSGMGEHRPAQSVLDPLYARAVVFECGGRKACVLELDLCIITEEFARRVRDGAAERLGFDPEAVMVHSIQSHTAPSCGPFMLDPDFPLETTQETEYLWGSETAYVEATLPRVLRAIEGACASLVPAQVGAASGVLDKIAFNRRGVTRDGSVCMPWPVGRRQQPFGPTHIRYMEGPIDPEVGVFCARTDDMRMVAMMLHYTCHPVNVFATRSAYHAVSADWPGAWAAGMQAAYGKACVPLIVNGCCGNINPWDPFDPDFVPDHRRMGAALADMACRLVPSIAFGEAGALDWAVRTVRLPYREIPAPRLAEVEKILSESPQPKWHEDDPGRIDARWFHAASTRSIEYCRRRMPEFLYEVQVIRIGDVAIVGWPGEPFVEGQLALKIQSPAKQTFVAHCASHYVGYLPTRDAYARGGHEANADCTYWAKLAPGSLETVVENTLGLLREVFRA